MATHNTHKGLEGQLLLATPQLEDARFEQGVILMLEHTNQGALGIMLNKTLSSVTLFDLFDQLDIKAQGGLDLPPVLFGGPVELGRGFVVHTPDVQTKGTQIFEGFCVTTAVDMLHKIAHHEGPQQWCFALGYAGWQQGQLEQELADNAWMHTPATPALLFDTDIAERWQAAYDSLGINPHIISQQSGRA
jgi:putative transcriptional regulator